jgi:hypothetical protein
MATSDFIPTGDTALRNWSLNFSTLITATPTAYGLTSGDATAYGTLHTAYASALTTALDPATRTPVTVAAKDSARSALVAKARELAAKVQATPSVTPAQKTSLGITPRDAGRTPIPPPSTRPVITINSTAGGNFSLRVVDETVVVGRKRPYGYRGAILYYATGASAPASPADCTVLGVTTRVPQAFDLSSVAVGTRVWLMAQWFNTRGQLGPASTVVSQIRAL